MFPIQKVVLYCNTYKNFVQNCVKILVGLPRQKFATVSLNTIRNMSGIINLETLSKSVKLSHEAYAEFFKSEETVPIVILHGLLGSKNNWKSIARALMRDTSDRMVITLDARNHGDSPRTDEFNYELMVADLLMFLKDKGISKVSLIGHSMGGRTCMLFALNHPYLVESLVVVDISPVGESPNMLELPKLFEVISQLQLDPYLTLKQARMEATAQLKAHNLDDKLISFLMTNLVDNDGNWRWLFNINSIKRHFASEICKFPEVKTPSKVPTLFVAGGDSDYIKKEDERDIKTVFTKAKFAYIPGAGHWVHAEKPQEFLSVVSKFLNSTRKNEEH